MSLLNVIMSYKASLLTVLYVMDNSKFLALKEHWSITVNGAFMTFLDIKRQLTLRS